MKKSIFFILFSLLTVSAIFAQNSKFTANIASGDGSRALTDLVCPDGSVYSQTPDGVNAWSYIAGYMFYDNVLTAPTMPVNKITWWMLEGSVQPTLSFDIFIHANNAGQPGTLIASYINIAFTAVNTGESFAGYPAYEYTVNLPFPVTINAGDWIGIRDLPDANAHHYWLTSSDGDTYAWFGEGYSQPMDFAFCLGGAGVTPISGWAIGIGIMLILAVTVLRIRKS
jgi:hypothetical protein